MDRILEYLEMSERRALLRLDEARLARPSDDHFYLQGYSDACRQALAMHRIYGLGPTSQGSGPGPGPDTPFGSEDELEEAVLEFHSYLAEIEGNLRPAPGSSGSRPASQMVKTLGRYFPRLGAHAARLLREREEVNAYDA